MGSLEILAGAVQVLARKMVVRKMVVVNYDLHNLKQKGLSLITTKKGEIMWVHSNLQKDEQCTSSTSSRKAKGKAQICNVIFTLSEEDQSKTATLTNSEVEAMVMVAHPNEVEQSGTQPGKSYLKTIRKFDQVNLYKHLECHLPNRKNYTSRRI